MIKLSALRQLMEMMDGDADDLAEFVGDFSEIAPQLVADMKSAYATQDANALRLAAHTLKSNARDMGATALSEMAAEAEAASKGPLADLDATLIDRISEAQVAAVSALTHVTFESIASE